MKITSYVGYDEGVAYVPEYANNRELPEEEQIVVYLKPLTRKATDRYRRMMRVKSEGKRKNAEWKTNEAEIQQKTFIENVLKVTNLQIEVVAENKILDNPTPEEVYLHAEDALIVEILNALQDSSVLEEGTKKH